MKNKRKEDGPLPRTWFRSDRLVEDDGKWFFLTREGTLQGPFNCRIQAVQSLEIYTNYAHLDLLYMNHESPLRVC